MKVLQRHLATAPLTSTFRFVRGVGPVLERRLWEGGCRTWDDIEKHRGTLPCSPSRLSALREGIGRARTELDEGRLDFIREGLDNADLWRVFPTLRGKCAYLDIETTGLNPPHDYVTLVGLYDGQTLRIFERGKDLDRFPGEIARYPFIVSFFGRGFDVPFLRKEFQGLTFNQAHWDLCPAFRRLGFQGGLKAVEVNTGLGRPSELSGISGFDAPSLWFRHEKGDPDALGVLKAYLAEDVMGLSSLAVRAYNLFASEFPIPLVPLAEAARPENPVSFSRNAVHRLLPHLADRRAGRLYGKPQPHG